MSRKKILIIHRALTPYRIDLLNELSDAFDADIFFEYDEAIEQTFDKEKMKERIRFSYRVLPASLWKRCPNFRPQLFSILRQRHYEVVLCSEFNMLTFSLFLLSHLYKFKLVVLCDDNENQAQAALSSQKLSASVKRSLIRRIALTVFCNRTVANLYKEQLSSRKKQPSTHYFPIVQDERWLREKAKSVPQDIVRRLRLQYALEEEDYVFLFVGRLVSIKNLPFLVQYFAVEFMNEPRVKLLLVGGGPLESSLRTQVAQLGLEERIILTGKHEQEALYAHYLLGDSLVLPSLSEAFGAVVNEALILGLPVGCTNRAGATTLSSESKSPILTFDPQKGDELCQVLRSLYTSQFSKTSFLEEKIVRPSLMRKTFKQYIAELIIALSFDMPQKSVPTNK